MALAAAVCPTLARYSGWLAAVAQVTTTTTMEGTRWLAGSIL
jgi:hypothetical protein